MLKKALYIVGASLVGVSLVTLSFLGAHKSLTELPLPQEIQAPTNVTEYLPPGEQETLKSSRESTVRILSLSIDGRVASTTGTYFEFKGDYYVLTVAHGMVGPCETTRIFSELDGFVPCLEVVVKNSRVDYAIIAVGELPSSRAIKLPETLPRAYEWAQTLSAQTKVFYTGYPNSTGPLTIDGRIVGYAMGDFIYLDSFAWGGASGSGVFSSDGKFIGYILAIDIGQTEYGIDVLENIVIVVPAFKIDWSQLSK